MNLYKIEYVFNKDIYDADITTDNVPEEFQNINSYFSSLPTHTLANDFFSAVKAASDILATNKYLYISNVTPVEINIRILEVGE